MISIQPWTTLSSKFVIDHQWCKVRQDQVKLPNGLIIDDYFINVRPDIVLILAVTPQREIVFVRQYRHGVSQILLELPGGSFNPQVEDSLIAASRELKEETGYIAEQMISLATLYDNPVKDTNKIHLILAENAQPLGKQQLDITEDVEIVLVPLENAQTSISSGEICVCGTIAALCLGLNWLCQREFSH